MPKSFHFFLSAKLAWKDLKNEPVLSLCLILGIVAVLAPLIVIAGLRNGVLTNIKQTLLEDPHVREIVNVSNRSFTEQDLKQIGLRHDVSFIIPRTRTLAASLFMEKEGDHTLGRHLMLVPTGKEDPLLAMVSFPIHHDEIILSASSASYLHIHQGDRMIAYLDRIFNGTKEQIQFPLKVISIVPQSVSDKDVAFVSLPLAVAVETYQDGLQDWPSSLNNFQIPKQMIYAGFRLYAKQLTDVPVIDKDLRAQHIDIVSRAGDVSGLLSLNNRLSLLFILIAALGGGGLCISLGSGLWANTERKHKSLAFLRFSGFSALDLICFPLIQSFILTSCGIMISFIAAYGAGTLINYLFKDILPQNHQLFLLDGWLVLITIGLTLGGSFIVSLISGSKAAKIQPWEGITAL